MTHFQFDRYVRGQRMAEGGRITRATTAEDALARVKALFHDSPDSTFVLRQSCACRECVHAQCCTKENGDA